MSHRTGLLFAYALLSACAVFAQDITEEPPRPTVTAVRLEQTETVTLDGRLDEAVWTRAVPATDFTQRDPAERRAGG